MILYPLLHSRWVVEVVTMPGHLQGGSGTQFMCPIMIGMEITAVIVIQSWKIPCFQACAWLPQTSLSIFDAWDKLDADKQTSINYSEPWAR